MSQQGRTLRWPWASGLGSEVLTAPKNFEMQLPFMDANASGVRSDAQSFRIYVHDIVTVAICTDDFMIFYIYDIYIYIHMYVYIYCIVLYNTVLCDEG